MHMQFFLSRLYNELWATPLEVTTHNRDNNAIFFYFSAIRTQPPFAFMQITDIPCITNIFLAE